MSVTFYVARVDEAGKRYESLADIEGLNVSNTNARAIATSLVLAFDEGEMPPVPIDTVLSRCHAFLRNTLGKPDPGVAAVVTEGDGRATLIDCGRSEGYLQIRVKALMDLARAGQARGATHIYGA